MFYTRYLLSTDDRIKRETNKFWTTKKWVTQRLKKKTRYFTGKHLSFFVLRTVAYTIRRVHFSSSPSPAPPQKRRPPSVRALCKRVCTSRLISVVFFFIFSTDYYYYFFYLPNITQYYYRTINCSSRATVWLPFCRVPRHRNRVFRARV